MPPKPGFFDALTRIDELILRNNKVLSALEAIFNQEEERELQNIYFAYPADGSFATLQAGTTVLDFRSGTITDVDGVVTKMAHSLQSEGRDLLRSFFINSDKLITIQPDSLDTIPADKEKDALATYQEFTRLTIVCTEATQVFLICCTSPVAAVRLISTTAVHTGDTSYDPGDTGNMLLAVRKDDVESLCESDGDYSPLIVNEHGILRTQAQQHKHFDECEVTTGWSVLGNDTVNLALTTNHVIGSKALEFDKVNGAANTVFATIQKTITSFDFTPYHKSGGFVLCSFYVSSLAEVDYVFLRLGTDASNYTEWRCDADDMEDGWNFCRFTASKPITKVGAGWNSAVITYVAVGVAFDAETDELADIAVDHIAANSGLLMSVPVEVPKNINLLKIGNKVVNVGAGDVGTGTQRVTIAGDDANLFAIKTALQIMDDWDDSDNCGVIPHPKGDIETTGTGEATGGGGTVTIATYTVTNGKTYHICNLHVACKTAHWLYLYIGGTERRRYYNGGTSDTVDWFAWDWHPLAGDVGGTKKIELKALKDDGGETLYGDFCGEEV